MVDLLGGRSPRRVLLLDISSQFGQQPQRLAVLALQYAEVPAIEREKGGITGF